MNLFRLLVIVNTVIQIHQVSGTIDVNLSELEYLAAHLEPFECRRLIAALHYTTYELPKSIDGAERQVDDDIPCLGHLLHWNSSPAEGRGKTHDHLEHRLRQIGRKDLADWLGKTVFTNLGEDLDNVLHRAFGALGQREAETQYPITMDPIDEPDEDDPWELVDSLLLTILTFLVICLLFLVITVTVDNIIRCRLRRKNNQLKKMEKRQPRRCVREKPEHCGCGPDVCDSETELLSSLATEEEDEDEEEK